MFNPLNTSVFAWAFRKPPAPASTASTFVVAGSVVVLLKKNPLAAVIVPVPVMTGAVPLNVTNPLLRLLLPNASVVPPARVRSPPTPIALLAPMVMVPALSTVGPVYVAVALSVRFPAPTLVNPPTPDPKLPARVISFPFVSNVPPPFRKLIVRVERSCANPVPRRNVPPANTKLPVVPPMLANASI